MIINKQSAFWTTKRKKVWIDSLKWTRFAEQENWPLRRHDHNFQNKSPTHSFVLVKRVKATFMKCWGYIKPKKCYTNIKTYFELHNSHKYEHEKRVLAIESILLKIPCILISHDQHTQDMWWWTERFSEATSTNTLNKLNRNLISVMFKLTFWQKYYQTPTLAIIF